MDEGMATSAVNSFGIHRRRFLAQVLFATLGLAGGASASPLLDRLRERRWPAGQASVSGAQPSLANVAYGADPAQMYDVYLPRGAPFAAPSPRAPVIFMVHGGAWAVGDKAMTRVVEAKVARWVTKGFVLVSVNYRMLPEVPPDGQLRDVALALGHAQAQAENWGADPKQFILMGHSAGAHLVALLAQAEPTDLALRGPPVLGTVALDSAAMDVEAIMSHPHLRLYDLPFGKSPSYWRAMSPVHQLRRASPPVLAVCSTRREDACAQARAFVARATQLGVQAQSLGVDLSHGEINAQLGLDNDYTRSVEAFMATLSPAVAQHLAH